jgi:hypothetical protein
VTIRTGRSDTGRSDRRHVYKSLSNSTQIGGELVSDTSRLECEEIDFDEISSEPKCIPKPQRSLIRHRIKALIMMAPASPKLRTHTSSNQQECDHKYSHRFSDDKAVYTATSGRVRLNERTIIRKPGPDCGSCSSRRLTSAHGGSLDIITYMLL